MRKPDLKAKERYRTELEAAIKAAQEKGGHQSVIAQDGTQVSAYPRRNGGIALGGRTIVKPASTSCETFAGRTVKTKT